MGMMNFFTEDVTLPTYSHASTRTGQANEHAAMVNFRQQLADQMWADKQNNNVN